MWAIKALKQRSTKSWIKGGKAQEIFSVSLTAFCYWICGQEEGSLTLEIFPHFSFYAPALKASPLGFGTKFCNLDFGICHNKKYLICKLTSVIQLSAWHLDLNWLYKILSLAPDIINLALFGSFHGNQFKSVILIWSKPSSTIITGLCIAIDDTSSANNFS